jgi:hypothetical protein
MMMRPKVPALAYGMAMGLAAAGLLVGLGVWLNRGSQTRLEGSILKVRTIATDEAASIAVLDVRIKNPARALFLVREVRLEVTGADGKKQEGITVSEPDLDRVLGYYPLAGPRFNPVLKARERLRGGETVDRTIAASFNVSERELMARRALVVRILDADGAVAEIGAGAER